MSHKPHVRLQTHHCTGVVWDVAKIRNEKWWHVEETQGLGTRFAVGDDGEKKCHVSCVMYRVSCPSVMHLCHVSCQSICTWLIGQTDTRSFLVFSLTFSSSPFSLPPSLLSLQAGVIASPLLFTGMPCVLVLLTAPFVSCMGQMKGQIWLS